MVGQLYLLFSLFYQSELFLDYKAKLKEIEDKNLYLEAYSRRENIIFEYILQAIERGH